MTHAILNSGAGPVTGVTTVANAWANMERLLEDARLPDATFERCGTSKADGVGGRFDFIVRCDGKSVHVSMPGLPIEQVRFVGLRDFIAPAPRLYVDGDSWYWPYAAERLTETLRDGGAS